VDRRSHGEGAYPVVDGRPLNPQAVLRGPRF
jgi:hypothetical protein